MKLGKPETTRLKMIITERERERERERDGKVILKTFEWKVYKKIVFYVELSNPNKDKNRMFFFVVEELE